MRKTGLSQGGLDIGSAKLIGIDMAAQPDQSVIGVCCNGALI
jgi:hypothetical protein